MCYDWAGNRNVKRAVVKSKISNELKLQNKLHEKKETKQHEIGKQFDH